MLTSITYGLFAAAVQAVSVPAGGGLTIEAASRSFLIAYALRALVQYQSERQEKYEQGTDQNLFGIPAHGTISLTHLTSHAAVESMAATATGEVGVISHVQEHGFHVGKPERLLARSLVFSKDVKLSQCNLIPLEPVFFSEVCPHVLDEGASDGGW